MMSIGSHPTIFLTAAFSFLVASPFAAAQSLRAAGTPDGGPVGVLERPRPEFDATAIRLGPFAVVPRLFTSASIDDNVFATRTARATDGVFRVQPVVTAATQWTRHLIQAEAAVEGVKYVNNERLDGVNARVGVFGRYDLGPATFISVNSAYSRQIDSGFGAAGLTPGLFPTSTALLELIPSNRFQNSLQAYHRINRLEMTAGFSANITTFEPPRVPAGAFSQTERNSTVYNYALRLGYRVSAASSVFVEGSYNDRVFRNSNLDSNGYRIVTGVSTDLFRLVRGEVFVGYMQQHFRNRRDFNGATFGARLRYFPTERLTFGLGVTRDISEPSAIGQASGVVTSVALSADAELLRNVLLGGSVQYANFTYADRAADNLVSVSVGPTWLLNRNFALIGQYRYTTRTSGFAGASYDRNQVFLTLRSQF